jgi:hypothetical protein
MTSTVLKDWITKEGYRVVVLRVSMGHNCGYIGVTKDHPLYGKTYSQHCDCLVPLNDLINALRPHEEDVEYKNIIESLKAIKKTAKRIKSKE